MFEIALQLINHLLIHTVPQPAPVEERKRDEQKVRGRFNALLRIHIDHYSNLYARESGRHDCGKDIVDKEGAHAPLAVFVQLPQRLIGL